MPKDVDFFPSEDSKTSKAAQAIAEQLLQIRSSKFHETYVVLALTADTVSIDSWRHLLNDAGISVDGQFCDRKRIEHIAAQGQKAGWLKREKMRVSFANAELRERLARDVPKISRFVAVCRELETRLNAAGRNSGYIRFNTYEDAVVGLRFGVVSGDPDFVNAGFSQAEKYQPSRWAKEQPLHQILRDPTADQWLELLHPGMVDWVLTSIRLNEADCLFASDHWQKVTERHLSKHHDASLRPLAAQLWEIALLKADTAAMQRLQQHMPEWQQTACAATVTLLQGKRQEALASYGQSLKQLRKESGKRTAYFDDVNGLFYLLLLIVLEGEADIDRIERSARQAEKNLRYDLQSSIQLLRYIEEQRRSDPISIALEQWFEGDDWFAKLLVLLIEYWFDSNRADHKNKKFSQQLLHLAKQDKLTWLEAQVQACDPSLASASASESKTFKLKSLFNPPKVWERKLDALRLLGNKASQKTGAADAAEGDSRLVWLFQWGSADNEFSVAVKEQRRTAKGWTKGRAVALKRLHEEEIDCMDEADRRAAASIEYGSDYANWRLLHTHYFRPRQLLYSLIDHPRLFFADDPNIPVDLVLREPALLVQKEDQKLLVTVEPAPDVGYHEISDWLLKPTGGNRIEFVPFSKEHLRIAELLGEGGLSVPIEAEDSLLNTVRSIAPMIQVQSDIGGGSNAGNAETVAAADTLFLFLSPMSEGLQIFLAACPIGPDGPRLKPGEGVANIMGMVAGQQCETQRDLERETQQLATVLNEWPGFENGAAYNASLSDLQDCLALLELLPTLSDSVTPVWPEGETLKLTSAIDSESLSVSVSSQQDWFALDGEIKVNDELVVGMSQLLTLSRETKGRYLPLGDGQFLNLTEKLRKQLQELADATETQGKKQRLNPYAIVQLEGFDDAVGKFKAPKKWQQQAQLLRSAMASEPELPTTFQAELRDYQLEGYRWLMRLSGWGAGACLADDMGLGKTLQALAALLAHAGKGPSLVVAPTSVAGNWLSEAQRFAPTLNIHRLFSGAQLSKLTQLGPFDVVIASYGIMQQGVAELAQHPWQMLVLDEAQAVKNAATKRAKAARELPAEFRVLLTGTPVENHLGDLWSILAISNPGLLGSQEKFNQRFVKPIVDQKDDGARQSLRRLVQPFILRRTKQAVLDELPPRTEINLHVELDETERALYEAQRREALERLSGSDAAKQDGHRQLQILAEITRLRRACCHPKLVMPTSTLPGAKLQQLLSVVTELKENNHRALVFSQFVDHLSIIREALDQADVNYQYIDGSTSAKKRDAAVKAFQAGEGDLFLISLKAGGFGLNLTAADYVIHMDPWWNPAVEDQASDRAHRMGQKRPVTIYRLITSGTIEEKIVALHQQKRGLADSLLAGTDQAAKMNADEVLALLREA